MIDFEEAVKQYGTDFHGKHGFPGSIGNMPLKKDAKKNADEKPEDPIKKILKYQEEQESKSANAPKMAKTGDNGQIEIEVPETGHPKTPVAGEAETPTPSAAPAETATHDEL